MNSYNNRSINGVSIATFLKKAQMEWDKAMSLGTRKNQAAWNNLADSISYFNYF